jgi:hypothetical protein
MQKSLKDLDDAPFAEEAERIQGKLPTIMFLNNLNDSLVISHRMNMPVAIDSIYVWMLKQRTKAQLTQRFSVLERLSRIGVPDFGDLSLEELLKLRKDKGLKAFRDFISTLSSGLKSDSDLNIEAAYTEEFMKLSREFAPNKKLALDLSSGVLSFIPCLLANVITSIADVGKKVKEYRDYSKTWVSFIQRANELDE